MADLSVKISVQIPGGPTIQSDRTVSVEKYKKIDLSLPPGESSIGIDFSPSAEGDSKKNGEGTGKAGKADKDIDLLLIQSSIYKDDGSITYSLGTEFTGKPLKQPLLLLGKEAIAQFGPPETISFSNTLPTEREASAETDADGQTDGKTIDLTNENTAKITILVGLVDKPK